jgi:hypothetical protein
VTGAEPSCSRPVSLKGFELRVEGRAEVEVDGWPESELRICVVIRTKVCICRKEKNEPPPQWPIYLT